MMYSSWVKGRASGKPAPKGARALASGEAPAPCSTFMSLAAGGLERYSQPNHKKMITVTQTDRPCRTRLGTLNLWLAVCSVALR